MRVPPKPAFDGPAQDVIAESASVVATTEAVLNPFDVYAKGEATLRQRLEALAVWHLRNIVQARAIVRNPDRLVTMTKHELIEAIVHAARRVVQRLASLA